jgi:hypothetical protein
MGQKVQHHQAHWPVYLWVMLSVSHGCYTLPPSPPKLARPQQTFAPQNPRPRHTTGKSTPLQVGAPIPETPERNSKASLEQGVMTQLVLQHHHDHRIQLNHSI